MRKLLGWIAVCGMMVSVAAAQTAAIPVVPTDHYGPPVCPGAKHAAFHDRVAAARAEQQEGIGDSHALLSDEPLENFDIERYKAEDYANCVGPYGCYWADIDTQYKRAETALAGVVKAAKAGERLAIVFDIDETALSKFCQLPVEDYGYLKQMDDAWTLSSQGILIPGALRLFNEAKADGVAVFFITGRPGVPAAGAQHAQADQTAATARNLEAVGFHGWAGLALKNGPENHMSVMEYKSLERKKIEGKGYHIAMSVGDQWSDLLGQPQADVSVKLPNPFYFLP